MSVFPLLRRWLAIEIGAVKPVHRCWAEVDLDALRGNLAWIRQRAGAGVKVMTVVKADAYGHGLKQIAGLLMQSGTDVFGVANLIEARAIRSVGAGWPVLMLGACLPEEVEQAVKDQVMVTVSSLAEAEAFSSAARKFKLVARLHLKVDTGMGRLGCPPEQAEQLLAAIDSLPQVETAGLYTHFSSVEDEFHYTQRQRTLFGKLLKSLAAKGRNFEYLHANNSAAMLLEEAGPYNTVRPGLLVYGVLPFGRRRIEIPNRDLIQPVLSLKCRISLIKDVPKGSRLSYGGLYTTTRTTRVATISAGYGDGYLRASSERANVLIGGERCQVLGRITMDQMLVDVTKLESVSHGDEVVLIGRQGSQELTATEVAQWAETVPWEVLTAITYRVPRVYLGAQAS
ncbi:MAG TPA: alanine racemase [Verrucomicrobiales bacterium]|nr:alanine racemase [Verrucomicrobiales bacterium]